jgi:hypothetical protein
MENKRKPLRYLYEENIWNKEDLEYVFQKHEGRLIEILEDEAIPLFTKADLEDAFEQGQNDIDRDGCGSGRNAFKNYFQENYEI